MLHWQCQPPNATAVGERWRELWEQRLATNRPWIHSWLGHPRRAQPRHYTFSIQTEKPWGGWSNLAPQPVWAPSPAAAGYRRP